MPAPTGLFARLSAWVQSLLHRYDAARDAEDDPFASDRFTPTGRMRRPTATIFNPPTPVIPSPPSAPPIPVPTAAPRWRDDEPIAEELEPRARELTAESIHIDLSTEGRAVTREDMVARAQDARSTEIMEPVPLRPPPLRRSVTERVARVETDSTRRVPRRATARLQRLVAPPEPGARQQPAKRKPAARHPDVLDWPTSVPEPDLPVAIDPSRARVPTPIVPLPLDPQAPQATGDDPISDKAANHLYNEGRRDPRK